VIRDEEVRPMNKWECTLCGYVYDPEEGDEDNDIEPGTPFDDLPPDWVCPDCGASMDEFDELEIDE
jgi:rubredoxin